MKGDNSSTVPHVVYVTTVGDVKMPFEQDRPVRNSLREALSTKFGPHFEVEDYDLIDEDGDWVDLDAKMRHAGIDDGDQLTVISNPVGGI